MTDGELILVTGALLVAALLASLVAGRVRVPGLVAVLGLGMLLGSDGLGWLSLSDYRLARTVGIIALALILFEGGLAAGFQEIRPVIGSSISLAVLGTLGTALIAGLAAAWLFDLPLLKGLLLGSIVASTDGAAIFAILRGSTLRRRLARTLEGEAGLNDPIAVLLVLGFIAWIQGPDYGVLDMLALFARQIAIGLAVGVLVGGAATALMARVRLPSAGLYPVASVAVAAVAYGAADAVHGSGFLAVYLAGLALGSRTTPASRTVATFHDGLAWVAQLVMFFVLGVLVFPSALGDVALEGTVLALVVVVVARPVAAAAATALAPLTAGERIVLGWAGLRGAVPVVLATFAVIERVSESVEFFNIVFFAVLISTLLQGMTFEPIARRLGATSEEAALPQPLLEPVAMRRLGAEIVEFPVHAGDAAAGRRVRELQLPRDALLNLIIRGDQAIPPRGSTVVEPGDRLHVLVRQEVAVEFEALLRRWRSGPLDAPEQRPRIAASRLFSTRPWRDADGDPAKPTQVGGIAVVEQLRTRRDRPGALVALADGRYAFTGPVAASGPPGTLQDEARRRLRLAREEEERAWWQEVVGALAQP